ncbi:dUTP diphosphatase [Intestinibacter sp.]|uniref:dUTP diphosphatase n=1 Tax=Intestinibacter sp. TaxID=1965304 RepID=UPI002A7660CE|nr:dUTP diphosphatase [Intestinibacter sp.]MDY2736830.1 dUTP diphosphatase [Intestinibacter sp.]
MEKVQIYNISNNPNPQYSNPTDAGADIRADFSRISPDKPIKIYGEGEIIFAGEGHPTTMLRLEPGSRAIIPTGIYTAIPEGYEVQLRPRSGLAIKKGLNLINCIGTIDASYKNEWGIPVTNQGLETIWIEDGERIAQVVLNKIEHINWESVGNLSELSGNNRGGGFGHTGTK